MSAQSSQTRARRKPSLLKRAWIRIRVPLARSMFLKRLLARLIYAWIILIYRTNRLVPGSDDLPAYAYAEDKMIATTWHGRHFMFACLNRHGAPLTIMVSRSSDAEMNALVLELGGIKTVRGSGGRSGQHRADKGGASALIQMKRLLDEGEWVGMVANVIKGEARQAGMGIITLAKISGKAILPLAYQTSRRKVLEKTWDKSVINWPFGRAASVAGEPIHVPEDATEEEMEEARQRLTGELVRIHDKADALLEGQS